MGIARKGKTRQVIFMSAGEEILIKFAMKVTGLDKTSTIRMMMRRGVIEMIFEQRRTGIPKLPDELQKEIDQI